jgi:hypothetical protein
LTTLTGRKIWRTMHFYVLIRSLGGTC